MGLSAAKSSQLYSGIGGSQSGPSFTGERIDVAYCIPCVPPAITAAGQAAAAVGGFVGGLWLGSKANIIYNEAAEGGNNEQRPSKTPNTGTPGSTFINPGNGQERKYGNDGKPEYDIDWSHDHGQGKPHGHNWDRGSNGEPIRGPGVQISPWPQGRSSGGQ